MECLTEGHEVLTDRGWIDISKIKIGDDVMEYDRDNNTINFNKVTNTSNHFSEDMYVIHSKNMRQVVSGGHRIYYEEKILKKNSCKEWKSVVTLAKDLAGVNLNTSHRRFRSTAPFSSENNINFSYMDALYVAYQADGSVDNSTVNGDGDYSRSGVNSGTIPIKFSFTKQRKIDRLYDICKNANVEMIEYKSNNSKRNFVVKMPVNAVLEHLA